MDKKDCLFIGHNEMDFSQYEKNLREMGTHSGAYRDLNLNFLQYNHKLYTASEIFNLFYYPGDSTGIKPLSIGETFNAAIAYLGTYLHRRGFTFDYITSFQEQKEELLEKLAGDSFRTIAIITTLYVSALPIIEIVEFIRQSNCTAKIIIGGPFVSTQFRTQEPETLEYLFNDTIAADFYVDSAQGEETLVNVLDALKNDRPFHTIANLYFKNGDHYQKNPNKKEDNRLSQNMVDWNLFSHTLGEFANLRTAISCPFSCSFCGFPEHAGKYQMAGPREIEEELTQLYKLDKVKYVHFIDDTFNVPVTRFKEILKMMIRKNFGFKWYSHFRCQFADRETVELMKESGCVGVFLGIESGSDTILKIMNKAAVVEKYLNGIQLLKEYDITTYGSFIIGFPGETDETIDETLQFIREGGLDFFRAQLWYCEPITPIFKHKEKYKITGESFEWSHLTMDSKEAMNRIEKIFLSIDEPIWVPQYNFECDGIFHLYPGRISMQEVKNFLRAFNNGIRERLLNPANWELDYTAIKQIKASFNCNHISEPVEKQVYNYDVSFDF
jgi:radical SAM PhpK family P-methyltransferase